jgi:nucleoside phosphorylase
MDHSIQNSVKVEQSSQENKADILIVAALYKERKWVQEVFDVEWRNIEREGVVYQVADYKIDDQTFKIVAVSQLHMGMPQAAVLTTKSIILWSPSVVVMTGICAGVEGQVNMGDLVIANKVFDYGSGKVVNGKLRPNFEPVQMDAWLWQLLELFRHDDAIMEEISREYPLDHGHPGIPLVAHLGSMGCGSAVVADAAMIEEIVLTERKLLALDMESYAVALATSLSTTPTKRVEFFIVKSVVDFANSLKGDTHHNYACYVSAAFVKKFVERYYRQLFLDNA